MSEIIFPANHLIGAKISVPISNQSLVG